MNTDYENIVIAHARKFQAYWKDKSEWYWAWRMLQEFCELVGSMLGIHKDTPDHEIMQIASIGINWLRLRDERDSK